MRAAARVAKGNATTWDADVVALEAALRRKDRMFAVEKAAVEIAQKAYALARRARRG